MYGVLIKHFLFKTPDFNAGCGFIENTMIFDENTGFFMKTPVLGLNPECPLWIHQALFIVKRVCTLSSNKCSSERTLHVKGYSVSNFFASFFKVRVGDKYNAAIC